MHFNYHSNNATSCETHHAFGNETKLNYLYGTCIHGCKV